ncbi:MAG: 4Fe-4S dicluster domain-containing protein, partial [Leptospiraceae bacterium]|nr:4Fe-4S dicluster domain-containing protein [Leptospiraceae bacterium]
PTFFGASYGQKRDVRHQKQSMNRLVVFESMFSVTGSSADERYSIRPGDQTLIALSLAAHLVFSGRGGATGNAARGLLEQYRAEKVAAAINRGLYQKGYFEKIIAGVADALYENRGRSLVVGASPLAATAINGEGQIAINLLNSILENDGVTVDHGAVLNYSTGASYGEIQSLLSELESDRYKTLIIAGANPVYHLPNTEKVTKALTHVDTILALNDRVDETAQLAKYVLPTSHWLEAWGDAEPINGIRSVQQPVVRPLYNTLSFEDYLIQLAGGQLAGVGTFHEYLKQRWSAYSGGTTFRNFWTGVLQQGFHAPGRAALNGRRNGRNFRAASLQRLPGFDAGAQKADGNKFVLGMYYGVQVLDGTGANNAYRQELPDPVTKIVWDNYVAILPERARALGLEQGSIVEIKARGQSLKLPVHLQPGLHPDAALVALGYGREQAGKIANGVGANVIGLSAVGSDTLQLSGVVVELNDTGDARTLASTQTIYRKGDNQQESHLGIHNVPYRGSSQHDRPLVRETSWKALQNGQLALIPAAVEYPQNKEIMPEWDYRDTRWHMVIDLNQCTGCGDCVTSCNIENNIPMVGRDQVAVGREMHWLRIDRYFSGEEAEAEVVHQPMLCQHCENAPCENVCPVAATTHSSEGLNLMTYNRCVGTRYCSNNCPYKVRRFNWYENFIWAEGLERNLRDPLQLGLNPDVTVRARGIMEKCTFCIQRISTARQESRARGERYIPDGRVKTACQEVCPTSAISFGNVLDPDSEVQKLRENGRAYQVLDFLGVKPSITYLAKVRNRDVEQG